MRKKASLSLSVNAIVVVVIAFVVLGLALTLTRTVFKAAMGKIPEAISLTALEAEPTAENTITIPETVEIGHGKSKSFSIGYYNKDSDTHEDVKLGIKTCLDPEPAAGAASVYDFGTTNTPVITSISQTVEASSPAAYKVILKENGLIGGKKYICTIAAYTGSSMSPTDIYDEKQFFLYVTS